MKTNQAGSISTETEPDDLHDEPISRTPGFPKRQSTPTNKEDAAPAGSKNAVESNELSAEEELKDEVLSDEDDGSQADEAKPAVDGPEIRKRCTDLPG